MRGAFLSFEGIEGTGKSTQSGLLADFLRSQGHRVVRTAEPGGTPISLKIRELLLSLDSKGMDHVTELLLYNAARVQHIKEVIAPSLARGEIVLTDRFCDSTCAYQGYGRGIDRQVIDALDAVATGCMRPDLTLLLDIDVETGLRRNKEMNKNDRLELEDIAFHQRVRTGFHEIAAAEPERIRVISCAESVESVHEAVKDIVVAFLKQRNV
ncbi:MAG: dTMP kinase [Nitrospirae bacterium]|nr:dTMP kinase [Nitrospirota bacterium]